MAGPAIDGWLDDLERAGNQLLSSHGREHVREAVLTWLSGNRPEALLIGLSSDCPPAHLQAAVTALRKTVTAALPGDGRGAAARRSLLAFARKLEAAARATAEAVPASKSRRSSRSDSPSTLLAQATAVVQRAKAPAGVVRAALAGAMRLCGADCAVWWEREDRNVLAAVAARGARLSREGRRIELEPALFSGKERGGAVVRLSPHHPRHASVLAALRAKRAVIVRVCEGPRWVAALSLHDGKLDEDALDLLPGLAQQAQAAQRVLQLEQERRQLAEGQSQSLLELGRALTSALSLDELLRVICAIGLKGLGADCALLFLADEGNRLQLRGSAAAPGRALECDPAALVEVAAEARARPSGQPLSATGSRLRELGGKALREAGYRSLLGFGMRIRGTPLGALVVLSEKARAFTPAQRQLMLSFVAQASVAIENLQLVEDTQRRLLEMADLNWVNTRMTATMDADRIAATVCNAAAQALDVPKVALFVRGSRGDYLPLAAGKGKSPKGTNDSLPPGDHLGAEVLLSGTPKVVPHVQREDRADDPLVRWMDAQSIICVPMAAPQGLQGIFVAADDRPRVFRSHALALASAYANQTALALQSALLYQDVVGNLNKLSKLFEVSKALASSLDLKGTLEAVLTSAAELLEAPICSVMLVGSDTKELVMKAAHGLKPDHQLYDRLQPGEGMAGRAAESGSPLVSADIRRDGRFKHRELARREGLRAAIAAPLVAHGRTVGVVNLYRKSSRQFTDDDKLLLTSLANSAAVAIENAHLYEEAQERADFLTAMMSEINHRTRNTLQAIAGMLSMETDRPERRTVEEVVSRGVARIRVIAVVHELMGTRDFRLVDLKQAARRVAQVSQEMAGEHPNVETRVTGARVMLPSQKATTAALILSELIDNAIRHGVSGCERGRINICLAEAGEDVVIQVSDDGVGFPADFDPASASGLGLTVVRGMVEQDLGGKLTLESRDGVTVWARFPRR